MKEFKMPQMAVIHFENENVIITSLCNTNYCNGFTCPKCDDNGNYCAIQTPCTAHQCGCYLCPDYGSNGVQAC